MKAKVNFYSTAGDVSGMLLETDIYLNKPVNEVIEQLQEYKRKYPEYDYLELDINSYEGYCLYGYVKGRVKGV